MRSESGWRPAKRSALAALVALALGLAALIATPSAAIAADRGARELARGIELYRAARFRKALRWLRRAQRRARDAAIKAKAALYLGLNYGVLRRERRAKRAFRRALELDPTLTLDPERFKPSDVRRLAAVRAKLTGRLTVGGGDGVVWVDGKAQGPAPQTLTLPVGRHVVELRASATRRARAEVIVRHGAQQTARLKLPAPARAPAPRPASGTTTPKAASTPAASTTPRDDGDVSAWKLSHRRIFTWVAAGLAVASAGVAIGLGVSAKADGDEYNSTNDPARADELKSSGQTKVLATNVLIGVAAGAAVASVLLYYFEGRAAARAAGSSGGDGGGGGDDLKDDGSALSLSVGPGAAMLRLRF